MTPSMISALKSFSFVAMAFIIVGIYIPKAVRYWGLWKETKNPTHLSNSIIMAIAAFFLLSGNFFLFIRAIDGYNV